MTKHYLSHFILSILFSCSLLAQNGINPANMDKSVRPQDDFFRFVNGNWLKKNEIPASEVGWGSFAELQENNQNILKGILEEAAKRKDRPKGSNWQQVGDLYTSGMDTNAINQLGIKPIQSELETINQVKSTEDLLKAMARLQTISVPIAFGMFIRPDSKNSQMNAVYLSQGGTGLPDRSYYLENNERFEKIRQAYQTHISKMFELAGESADNAKKMADKIYKIEYRLAEAQRTRVDLRNPQKGYNKKSMDELNQMVFNIDWKKYFEYLGAKNVQEVIVGQPEFIAIVDRMLKDVSMDDWKSYLKWKVLTSHASFLSKEFEMENFKFYSMTLNGVKEMRPRWKRILQVVDGSLGQPLGQLYVEKTFPPQAKARMMEMIENIREAFAERMKKYDWMSDETKTQALRKLNAIIPKIGYPDKWRDFSSVDIKSNDYLGNILRIRQFNYQYNLAKIGQPVDKSEFGMTPPTVNAYYSPVQNEIAFPAGILQPPFFDFKADDAVNYGAIGAVIGHEITHGFDDQGSQYDAEGNLKMWWTKEDRAKFEALANRVVEQYNGYTVLDSVHVNGKLTLGENIADLGGVTLAYDALQRQYQKKGRPKNIGGFTPEQRFFIGFGQIWRAKYRNEAMLQRIKTDPHSPGEYRANGTLSNVPYFFEAFQVKEGDKMRLPKEKITVIW
jgi:putative endopeptidase